MTRHDASPLADTVQRYGLLSAAVVVDRYQDLVDRAMGEAEVEAAMTGVLTPADPSWLIDRASRLASGYLRFLDTAAAAVEKRDDRTGVERVALPATPPGATARGILWIHNPGAVTTVQTQIAATPLVSSSGTSIPADRVSFDLPDVVAPGAVAEIQLTIDVPAGIPPGRYLGLAHLRDGEDDPVALDLEVVLS